MTDRRAMHIWIGNFPTEESLEAYFEESFSEDNDTPLNAFALDQGIGWYDHDGAEFMVHHDHDPCAAVLAHGYFTAEQQRIEQALLNRSVESGNATVIVDASELDKGRDVIRDDFSLYYLGCFEAKLG